MKFKEFSPNESISDPREQIKEDLPKCFIVFSDKSHADHIFSLINPMKSVLEHHRLEPILLGDEIRSSEDYLEKLEEFVEQSVLGIVILDGLRPNVSFEFGYLKGKNKPLIIIQSKQSDVNIKTLYKNDFESGLEPRYFSRLKNPKLDAGKHISDFAGKHIAFVEKHARDTDEKHICQVLEKELQKIQLKEKITKEKENITSKFLHGPLSDETTNDIISLGRFNEHIDSTDSSDIISLIDSLNNTFKKFESKIPISLVRLMCETCYSKAHDMRSDKNKAIEMINKSITIYENALSSPHEETQDFQNAFVNYRLGSFYSTLDSISNSIKHSEKCLTYFNNALKLVDKGKQKLFYGIITKNMAIQEQKIGKERKNYEKLETSIKLFKSVTTNFSSEIHSNELSSLFFQISLSFFIMSDIKDKIKNLDLSLNFLEKYSKLDLTPKQIMYGEKFKGQIYEKLSNNIEPILNTKKAIEHFQNALDAKEIEKNGNYAEIYNWLGICFQNLVDLEAKSEWIDEGIDAFEQAAKIWTLKEFPILYAGIQMNLGTIYGMTSRIMTDPEKAIEHAEKCLMAYEDAKKYGYGKSDLEKIGLMMNLGNAYGVLAELLVEPEKNCEKSIECFKETLELIECNEHHESFINCHQNLGASYIELAKIKDSVKNYTNAISSFDQVLNTAKKNQNELDIAMGYHSKGLVYLWMARSGIKDFCNEGIECLMNALKFYTKEIDPIKYKNLMTIMNELRKICNS